MQDVAEQARQTMIAMSTGNTEALSANLHADVIWHLPASLSRYGLTTRTTGSAPVVAMAGAFAGFFRTIAPTIEAAVAVGDTAAVLMRMHGITLDDRVYDNVYSFWLRFADGLVIEGRELTDTSHAALFFQLEEQGT